MHAEHPLVQRVVLGDGALAEQRVHQRRLQLLREAQHRGTRARDDGAVADVEHGLLRARQQRGRLRQRGRVGLSGWVIPGQIQLALVDEVGGAARAGDVLGKIDQHRAGASGGGEVKRLARDARNVVRVLDQVRMLHHRVGDSGDVGFLERVLAEHRRDGLSGEDDHWHRVHQRRQQAGDRVGRARTRRHEHDARLAG